MTVDAIHALGNQTNVHLDLGMPDRPNAGDFLAIAAGVNLRL